MQKTEIKLGRVKMKEYDKATTCKCGKTDLRRNMWYNPDTKDIKCRSCFDLYAVPIQPKNWLENIVRCIFGEKYPEDMADYYQGNSEVGMKIS